MPRKKPKFEPEQFRVTAIPGTTAFYYTVKIVGSNFKTNIASSIGRRAVTQAFLDQAPMSKIELGLDEETRKWLTDTIQEGRLPEKPPAERHRDP